VSAVQFCPCPPSLSFCPQEFLPAAYHEPHLLPTWRALAFRMRDPMKCCPPVWASGPPVPDANGGPRRRLQPIRRKVARDKPSFSRGSLAYGLLRLPPEISGHTSEPLYVAALGSPRLNVARFDQVIDGERRRGGSRVRGLDRRIRGRWGITASGGPSRDPRGRTRAADVGSRWSRR
jgi:hypothetical protein